MSTYRIQTRRPETEASAAGEWTADGLGDVTRERYATVEEAEVVIDAMRHCGPDWAAAEYRVVRMGCGCVYDRT